MRRSSPIVPFDLSKAYVLATNGVLPALDAHLLTNLPEKSIVILDTEKDRTDLTTPEDVLYFVKATRTIYYFYSNTWYYVSGNPTGGNTSTATISVSATNEITADIKTSSTSGNIIEIKSDGLYAKFTLPDGGSVGQVLKKTNSGVEWSDDLVGDSITIDSSISDSSTNPVQNKIVKEELDKKITAPASGTVGQVLAKTASGVEWVNQTEQATVDSNLSDSSENAVQNKVVKAAIDEKISNPSGGSTGQVLSKTNDGYAWVNQTEETTVDSALSDSSENPVQNKVVTAKFDTKAELNYLLFRIPEIEQGVTYHFKIDFSETDDFASVMSYYTSVNYSYFKAFTGTAMVSVPSTGLNYIFSDEQLQFSLERVPSTYKYFRFHWSNDDGITYGRYGYGSVEASQQIFDISSSSTSDAITFSSVDTSNKQLTLAHGSNTYVVEYGNTVPKNTKISFTSSNSTNVTWNGAVATFTHNMNCIPIASIYDNTMEQALYGVKVVNANTVTVDFNDVSNVTGTWKLILAYGCDYE